MDRVLDRLWIGSSADLEGRTPLRELGFVGVVDLRDGYSEASYGEGVAVLRLLNRDGDPWPKRDVAGAFAFVSDCIARGKVLVACVAGMSRSASLVVGYLVRCGWSADEAYRHLKQVRPQVAPIPAMLGAAILKYDGGFAVQVVSDAPVARGRRDPLARPRGTRSRTSRSRRA